MHEYPIYAKSKSYGRIVEFTGLKEGTVIVQGHGSDVVGYKSNTWIEHTNKRIWEPCEDPRQSRTNKMLKALNEQKDTI